MERNKEQYVIPGLELHDILSSMPYEELQSNKERIQEEIMHRQEILDAIRDMELVEKDLANE